MLHVLIRIDSDTYAIGADVVTAVVPFARLKKIPTDLPEVVGVLNYRGTGVPVIDLQLLLGGREARPLLTSRIAIASVMVDERLTCSLGLLAEQIDAVERFDPGDFRPAPVREDGRGWLGPLAERDGSFIQRLDPGQILRPEVVRALAPAAEEVIQS